MVVILMLFYYTICQIILCRPFFLFADIDECIAGLHNCHQYTKSKCSNTIGRFWCECFPNHLKIGKACLGIESYNNMNNFIYNGIAKGVAIVRTHCPDFSLQYF